MKSFLKQTLLIVTLLIFPISLALISHVNSKNKNKEVPILPGGQERISLPIRLRIPKINVDATVDYVGITPTGNMDVPAGPEEVAWFELGPRPGEIGSSVIDGHSGWKDNIPAVFDDLDKLKVGDKVYIEDEKGETITFVVREIHTYKPNENVPTVFNSSDGKAHLNLITCTGIWNMIDKTHSDRLVIFTDKE